MKRYMAQSSYMIVVPHHQCLSGSIDFSPWQTKKIQQETLRTTSSWTMSTCWGAWSSPRPWKVKTSQGDNRYAAPLLVRGHARSSDSGRKQKHWPVIVRMARWMSTSIVSCLGRWFLVRPWQIKLDDPIIVPDICSPSSMLVR